MNGSARSVFLLAAPLVAAIAALALIIAQQPSPAAEGRRSETSPLASGVSTLTPSAQLLPDLIVRGIEWDQTCHDGVTSNTGNRIWLMNIGTADAGPFSVSDDEFFGQDRRVEEGLEADGRTSILAGHYGREAFVRVDSLDEVEELDETNNTYETASLATATPKGPCLEGDVDCGGGVSVIDAALILQFSAGLLDALRCRGVADVSHDQVIDAIDATLVLQFMAGLLDTLSS